MENKPKKALHLAALRIFEDVCFMFEAAELEEAFKDQKEEAEASVEFSGPIGGRLLIKVSSSLLLSIAENMLGEEAPTKKQQLDALGEIANIICGNILPSIYGSKEVFKVASPKIEKTGPQADKEEPAAEVSIILDSGRVELALYVNEKVALMKDQHLTSDN